MVTFSSKFDSEEQLLASRKAPTTSDFDHSLETLSQKLATLRGISTRFVEPEAAENTKSTKKSKIEFVDEDEDEDDLDFEDEIEEDDDIDADDDMDEEEFEEEDEAPSRRINGLKPTKKASSTVTKKSATKKSTLNNNTKNKFAPPPKPKAETKKLGQRPIIDVKASKKKSVAKPAPKKAASPKPKSKLIPTKPAKPVAKLQKPAAKTAKKPLKKTPRR